MVKNVVNGQKYWCCMYSIESMNGCPDCPAEPVRPWQGVVEVKELPVGTLMYLRQFGPDGRIDEDTNATALVGPEHLFDTQEEAASHYRKRCLSYGLSLFDRFAYFIREALDGAVT